MAKSVGYYVRLRRLELGYSQQELALMVGYSVSSSRSSISQIESDKKGIPQSKLPDFAKALKVSVDYFYGGSTVAENGMDRLPVIGLASAGKGVIAEEDVIDYEYVDDKYLNDNFFYIRVVGDSMKPRIEDGDLALVHKQPVVDNCNVAIVTYNGKNYIKQFSYDNDEVKLKSFNESYEPICISTDELSKLKIIGKVIRTVKKW